MNKTLKSILKKIEIHSTELNNDILENTKQYNFIYKKIAKKEGEPTFKRALAMKLIAEEVLRGENYRSVDFSRYKNEIKELLAGLSEEEMSDLLSYHFGGSDKRKYEIIENIEYLISNNEKVNLNFIINVLANSIVDEVNYEVLLVKLKLQQLIPMEEWYNFYEINKEGYSSEDYQYQIEKINDILSGVLK